MSRAPRRSASRGAAALAEPHLDRPALLGPLGNEPRDLHLLDRELARRASTAFLKCATWLATWASSEVTRFSVSIRFRTSWRSARRGSPRGSRSSRSCRASRGAWRSSACSAAGCGGRSSAHGGSPRCLADVRELEVREVDELVGAAEAHVERVDLPRRPGAPRPAPMRPRVTARRPPSWPTEGPRRSRTRRKAPPPADGHVEPSPELAYRLGPARHEGGR